MKRYAQAKKIQTDTKRYNQINKYNRYIGLNRLYRLSVWHQVQKDKDVKEIWNVPEPPWVWAMIGLGWAMLRPDWAMLGPDWAMLGPEWESGHAWAGLGHAFAG